MPKGERVRVKGDYVKGDKFKGDKVFGDKVMGDKVLGDQGMSEEDLQVMLRFIDAVTEHLGELSPSTRPPVEAKLVEIKEVRSRPTPSRKVLRELGVSLRTVLEGATGDVLAGSLLGIWAPPS